MTRHRFAPAFRAWDAPSVGTGRARQDEALAGIRCPLCAWRPTMSSTWCCYWTPDSPEPSFKGCLTVWNTFLTRGRCPGCSHRWGWTSCHRCGQWSPHEEWYETPDDRDTRG